MHQPLKSIDSSMVPAEAATSTAGAKAKAGVKAAEAAAVAAAARKAASVGNAMGEGVKVSGEGREMGEYWFGGPVKPPVDVRATRPKWLAEGVSPSLGPSKGLTKGPDARSLATKQQQVQSQQQQMQKQQGVMGKRSDRARGSVCQAAGGENGSGHRGKAAAAVTFLGSDGGGGNGDAGGHGGGDGSCDGGGGDGQACSASLPANSEGSMHALPADASTVAAPSAIAEGDASTDAAAAAATATVIGLPTPPAKTEPNTALALRLPVTPNAPTRLALKPTPDQPDYRPPKDGHRTHTCAGSGDPNSSAAKQQMAKDLRIKPPRLPHAGEFMPGAPIIHMPAIASPTADTLCGGSSGGNGGGQSSSFQSGAAEQIAQSSHFSPPPVTPPPRLALAMTTPTSGGDIGGGNGGGGGSGGDGDGTARSGGSTARESLSRASQLSSRRLSKGAMRPAMSRVLGGGGAGGGGAAAAEGGHSGAGAAAFPVASGGNPFLSSTPDGCAGAVTKAATPIVADAKSDFVAGGRKDDEATAGTCTSTEAALPVLSGALPVGAAVGGGKQGKCTSSISRAAEGTSRAKLRKLQAKNAKDAQRNLVIKLGSEGLASSACFRPGIDAPAGGHSVKSAGGTALVMRPGAEEEFVPEEEEAEGLSPRKMKMQRPSTGGAVAVGRHRSR